jgi:hypothetical protein
MEQSQQEKENTNHLVWLHLAVCALLMYFVIGSQQPSLTFLSQLIGLDNPVNHDPLGALLRVLSIIGLVGYFLTISPNIGRRIRNLQLGIISWFVIVYIVMPSVNDMFFRQKVGIQYQGRVMSIAHDGGVLQTEAAIKFMLAGVSPYSADYSKTEMSLGMDSTPQLWKSMGFEHNPAYDFYPYPPGMLVLSAPFYLVFDTLFGWYDQRIIYLLFVVLLFWIGLRLANSEEQRSPLVAFIVLNPFLAVFLPTGRNDIVCLTLVLGVVLAIKRERILWTAILLALACASKQYAWFFVPFVGVLFYARYKNENISLKKLRLLLIVFFGSSLVIWLPFLIWAPLDLLYDLFVGQSIVYPYRPRGFGIADFLIVFNLIDSHRDSLSLLVPMLFAVLGVITVGVYRCYHCRYQLGSVLKWYGITLFVLLFFSKFFAANHFALVSIVLILGVIEVHKKSPNLL